MDVCDGMAGAAGLSRFAGKGYHGTAGEKTAPDRNPAIPDEKKNAKGTEKHRDHRDHRAGLDHRSGRGAWSPKAKLLDTAKATRFALRFCTPASQVAGTMIKANRALQKPICRPSIARTTVPRTPLRHYIQLHTTLAVGEKTGGRGFSRSVAQATLPGTSRINAIILCVLCVTKVELSRIPHKFLHDAEIDAKIPFLLGEVSEWFKEHAWKVCVR